MSNEVILDILEQYGGTIFSYGLTVGIYISISLYLLFFAIFNRIWHNEHEQHACRLFFYGSVSTLCHVLFSIYCMPLHFSLISSSIPNWVLFLGQISIPIGTYLSFRMFVRSVPINTLTAFLFWYKSKRFYPLFYVFWFLSFLALIFISNPIYVVIISVVTMLTNMVFCMLFIYSSFFNLPLLKLYGRALIFCIISFILLIPIVAFMDLRQIPDSIFLAWHFLYSIWVVFYLFVLIRYIIDDSLPSEVITKFNIAGFYKDFYRALQNHEFYMEYQPKINLRNKELCGMEALVRWEHPEKGLIPPDDFIPVAEQTDIINQLTEWVILRVMSEIKTLHDKGTIVPVSINFSVRNITPSMVKFLFKQMEKYKINSSMVVVEITESLFLDLDDEKKLALELIHRAGIKLSLDDFGAGFSSLRYLDEIGLSEIKIDKSLIDNMLNEKKRPVVRTIMTMCQELGIDMVAEGVNDEETIQALLEMECEVGQGFGLCRPKRIHDISMWIEQYQSSLT